MPGVSLRFDPSVRLLLPLSDGSEPRIDLIGPSIGYEHLKLQTSNLGVELQVLSPLTVGLAVARARFANPRIPVPMITHSIHLDHRLSVTTDLKLDEHVSLSFDVSNKRVGLRWTF